ncbi:MAG: DUF819 family protein [Candidatus Omnitrophota bacterium]|jgi:uncharacterized membrane protein|nr:MAG: DUF819 family protein [Candidatus Omnitrophota bacterium]
MITNDAVVLGLLCVILAMVFGTASSRRPVFRAFYKYVPSILLCYFIPALLSSAGIISDEHSNLYFIASRYLLPACLVLLTLSIDLKAVVRLGPKLMVLFLTGTIGVILGGPLAILIVSIFSPETVGGQGPDAVWRGLTTVAGSWIGGGANQAAMKEVFEVGDDIFGALIAVDVLVANLWMAVLLLMAGNAQSIDRWNKANTADIEILRRKMEEYKSRIDAIPSLSDTMMVLAAGFGVTAIAHGCADYLSETIDASYPALARFSLTSSFFWLVVIATSGGLLLSFTPARRLEGVGASRIGSVFLYLLVATIGMKMNVTSVVEYPGLYVVGLIWIAIHAALLLIVARLIRAPVFFLAVGSQANIGGAASAPIVASAFHPVLAPVGVLVAVLGYALGTYGAWICGQLMRLTAPM